MRLLTHQRAEVELLLRRGLLDEAHQRARNDGDLHARVHLAYAARAVKAGRPKELGFQLWQAALAPVASAARRRGGFAPDEPNAGGIWATLRGRRQ